MRALIGTVFQVSDDELRKRIAHWAQHHAKAMRSLGAADLVDPEVVASCYPLHPLTAMILPELCSRYGQHERTLFSFLASGDPSSAASFLATAEIPNHGPLPSLGLEAVYDYFVTHGSPTAISRSQVEPMDWKSPLVSATSTALPSSRPGWPRQSLYSI